MAGKKAPADTTKRVPYGQTTGLGAGYERAAAEGAGIQPGAHPEFGSLKPGLRSPAETIRGFFKPKRGGFRSPSTVKGDRV